jgi:hypothetical protein
MKKIRMLWVVIFALLLTACSNVGKSKVVFDRESLIPVDAPKMLPENDLVPPELHSDEFEAPVPLPYPVNTRGAEDSAFVMPDGKTLYVWFTPNNRMDVIEQSQDTVTGIYKFEKQADGWSPPERLWLVTPGTPHLDGCGFFLGDRAWICGVRAEYEGIHWFTSEFKDGVWSYAKLVDFDPVYEVGELHISKDGMNLYFHSDRPGGLGGRDVWLSRKVGGDWGSPENLTAVNSEYDEGWPALNPQEDELWITRNYGIWRSKKVDGEWTEVELIVSALAGEASIDQDGNVFFTHHFFEGDHMIEADIYVIYRK